MHKSTGYRQSKSLNDESEWRVAKKNSLVYKYESLNYQKHPQLNLISHIINTNII